MNCSHVKFYGIFMLLFFFNSNCFAQSNDENETDSSGAIIAADSANSDSENIGDTAVTKIVFDNSNDSLLKWKRSPEFSYMAYLDSLLKKKKNDLRIDTINIDKNTGRNRSK